MNWSDACSLKGRLPENDSSRNREDGSVPLEGSSGLMWVRAGEKELTVSTMQDSYEEQTVTNTTFM